MTTLPEGPLLHQIEFPIRWGDMDALGHVNNIMYFRYFEQARLGWYEAMGFASLSTADTGMVIVNNSAEYLKPLVYPAQVTVSMSGHSVGNSSFTSAYTITADNTLYTRGEARVVWVDLARNKATRLPESVREALQDSHRHHGATE